MILLENLVRTFQLFGLTSVLTFLIIFGLVFFFSAQIFAWVTPPRPRILNALVVGVVGGSILTYCIYSTVPLAPALITASINGVYGYPGYAWAISIVFLLLVFVMNTSISWNQDRPLEVFQ